MVLAKKIHFICKYSLSLFTLSLFLCSPCLSFSVHLVYLSLFTLSLFLCSPYLFSLFTLSLFLASYICSFLLVFLFCLDSLISHLSLISKFSVFINSLSFLYSFFFPTSLIQTSSYHPSFLPSIHPSILPSPSLISLFHLIIKTAVARKK